jgi:hypothetical protein
MDGGVAPLAGDSVVPLPGALPLSLRELAARITELAGHLNAANAHWLALIAEFDRRAGWSDGATRSCAHWLNWKCGLTLGAAREKLRVAHALEHLPQVRGAMARGALSYSKVRAITRVADSRTEEMLLEIALHGTASHVENVVRHYRRACELEELSREARQQAARCVTWRFDDDGSMVMSVRLPAEAGVALVDAIDRAVDEGFHSERASRRDAALDPAARRFQAVAPRGHGVSEEMRVPIGARRADALARIAESFLAHGFGASAGGERHQVVVHVDEHTLRCGLEHGPAIPVETMRRLSCDASVVRIVEDARGEPLDVGRKTRSIPPALRRALQSRDRGCRFPGCAHTRYVDAHHVRHWAQGGETRLSNLVTLCRFHHRAVHEGGVQVQLLDDGALRFLDAHGNVFALPDPPDGSVEALRAQQVARGLAVDASTAVNRWGGERIDYDIAVAVLLSRRSRARRDHSNLESSLRR